MTEVTARTCEDDAVVLLAEEGGPLRDEPDHEVDGLVRIGEHHRVDRLREEDVVLLPHVVLALVLKRRGGNGRQRWVTVSHSDE